MKLTIAKIVYWGGIGVMILLALSLLALLLINLAPIVWAILAIFVVGTVVGMAFGWAEKEIEKSKPYKNREKKLGGK
jgi:hypothetical protein